MDEWLVRRPRELGLRCLVRLRGRGPLRHRRRLLLVVHRLRAARRTPPARTTQHPAAGPRPAHRGVSPWAVATIERASAGLRSRPRGCATPGSSTRSGSSPCSCTPSMRRPIRSGSGSVRPGADPGADALAAYASARPQAPEGVTRQSGEAVGSARSTTDEVLAATLTGRRADGPTGRRDRGPSRPVPSGRRGDVAC